MDESTLEIRSQARIDTLNELATLVDAGMVLTSEGLRERAREVEAAKVSIELFTGRFTPESDAYPANDPKHPEYHSTHVDIWDLRERG